jgi:hypothetical protein
VSGNQGVSDAKIKKGIIIGPQIRKLTQDKQFHVDLNETEKKMHGRHLRGFARTYQEIKKWQTT